MSRVISRTPPSPAAAKADTALPTDEKSPDAPDFSDAANGEGPSDLDQDLEQDFGPVLVADDETPPEPGSIRHGVEVIRANLKHAPLGPGVYRMIAANGEVLYVGKARSIRRRIASYAREAGHSNRIARMIALAASMVFVSTATETEALLLEANYIKQMKPRFNVLLRDDKSFPYIVLTGDHVSPQLTKHRGARARKGDYFGPFANVQAVNRTLNALQRAFLLRSCTDSFYENRTRPCLLWQIKRCAGPCTGEVSHENYTALVGEARDFLSGKSRAVRERLAQDMNTAAEALEFETAARLRDRIAALSAIQGTQGINPRTVEEADVFAIIEEAGQFAIEVFFFRTFQNWGNRAYYPRADRSLTSGEVLDAFLAQFYADKPAPRLVLLSHEIENREILADALSARAGRKVEVAVPQRGERRELVEHATQNARETLGRKLADTAAQEKLLAALAEAFGFKRPLQRVEVYDNSHIMGTNAIGAMVVAGRTGFMKAHYRTFNIKSTDITPGDDYGMMREVLMRRFSRLKKEETASATEAETETSADAESKPSDAFPSRPDLILIDGGKGQFEEARKVLTELGIEGVELASIAKGPDRNAGRETFFVEGREPFKLPPRDPALYFIQRLRDEAHRFAIGTHRARRKKDFVRSPLDEIAGIGPARKRALLQTFGTAKAVGSAALSDLEKVPGVNAATAKLIYDFFHDKA
ncbi:MULTISPECIES: excinuclease ABC subunit UvrC [unclassified Beijerinckia]|uniref:excinuclease ABC subunit UvrC n=1 Tax=unclassified Beijerinckia TaxID=2638183 RepID=UPI00089457B0|nr:MULTISPECIES: excinuclease ABC subunit UvrC [unclassified Beijerinckia]MDH7799965.1 excinuclease ABC subunit C [Beijerinckia sp. GAS462]SED44199.1 Excinuclease ABC subunit C [Beijerinckia sp. 28-YEA-48]